MNNYGFPPEINQKSRTPYKKEPNYLPFQANYLPKLISHYDDEICNTIDILIQKLKSPEAIEELTGYMNEIKSKTKSPIHAHAKLKQNSQSETRKFLIDCNKTAHSLN